MIGCDFHLRSSEVMSHRLNVRVAGGTDIPQLVELDLVARRDERRRAFIKHAIDAGQCWVAGEADDPVQLLGYGVLNQSFFDQNFVALVVVREVARRRGVATTIMNALEA
jgi:hypothetical protein